MILKITLEQFLVLDRLNICFITGYVTNRGILKAEDFCVSRGSVYNTHGLVENYGPEVITLPRFSHYRIKESKLIS